MIETGMDGTSALRLRVLEAAREVFGRSGFEAATMGELAEAAEAPLSALYPVFPSKVAVALGLYRALVGEVEAVLPDLPPGTMAQRFAWWMAHKLDRLDEDRATFTALVAAALDPAGPAGVLSPATASIRSRVSGCLGAVVSGATDAPPDEPAVARLLYGVHLLLIVLWTQDPALPRGALGLFGELLTAGGPYLSFPPVAARVSALDALFGGRLASVGADVAGASAGEVDARARVLIERLMYRRRRLSGPEAATPAALAPHLPVVVEAIRAGRPLQLVLPAFPAKSPNPRKVLGTLPDLAERLALANLVRLCRELAEGHAPGVDLVICSDGLVFADVVEVPDADVLAYGGAIDAHIAEAQRANDAPQGSTGTPNVRIRRFDLADAWGPIEPSAARARLLTGWAEPEDVLRERCHASPSLAALLDGLHRFLFEDAMDRAPVGTSRTSVRQATRARAYQLLQRSRAWGRLVAASHPDAVRLSIHPQPEVSEKIGVHLVDTDDVWLTPWHGVALLDRERFRLVKRFEAEQLGAVRVGDSHYELP